MRTPIIDHSLFTENRMDLMNILPEGCLAVLKSNLTSPTNADANHPYKQNSNLYYLTGVLQEETSVILFPNAANPEMREILFVRESDPLTVIWEGKKLSVAEARERSGIQTVKMASEFESFFRQLAVEAYGIALETNEHLRASATLPTGNELFVKQVKEWFPLHSYHRLSPLLTELRMLKSAAEMEQVAKALKVTGDGFKRVLKATKPGVGEWEIEAEYIYEFIRQGSQGHAYEPIVASGANSCVLHYISNDQRCENGDLLLMDVGAEWNGYNADMTRVIPVNGTFTERQRAVYNAVLRAMRYAATILRPGIYMKDYHELVMKFIGGELVQLGLISEDTLGDEMLWKGAVRKYYMHGTSHHLGIDVHDVSSPNCIVETGMLFTIEPGIYLPDEGIGVRLEDNYYIGEQENLNLSAHIPVEAEEIEALMKS